MSKRILIAGESWVTYSIHIKGADSFTSSTYEEGLGWLRAALEGAGHEVVHLPSHLAHVAFPFHLEDLTAYDVVMLSDIGTNTLLLPPKTAIQSIPSPNRLQLINDYVMNGGGLVMVGGYMTFQGIEGKARYHNTPVEAVLPVEIMAIDDRIECPQGTAPHLVRPDHPVVVGLPEVWPDVLGYNQVTGKEGADVLVKCGDDPLVVVWGKGKGRSMAFTSDCGPHWAPPSFVEWPGYQRFWRQAVDWLSTRV